ncbi:hypothetical protein JCM9279_004200 [Rhodotorula babjevae]
MPPRRSSRKRKAAHDSDDDYEPAHEGLKGEDDGGGDENLSAPAGASSSKTQKTKAKASVDSEEEDYAPPKKKTTASKTKGKGKSAAKPRGNRGKLSAFTSMPLDVLALIMSHLDTKTVLACSRTCSSFRTLLHSSQGTSCWKAARFNTSRIPDLEAGDMPEWEYASLLFDGTCHVCHKSKAKTVDFYLRVLGCAPCMRSNSLRAEKLHCRQHPKALECVPESQWSPFDWADENGFGGGGERTTYTFFWEPQVRAVSARLYELDGKPGFDEYVKERKRIKAAAKRDGGNIKEWEAIYSMVKEDDAHAVRMRRRAKIDSNLLALGYTAAEIRGDAVRSHSLYNAKGELTDRAWNSAKAKFVAALEAARVEQRERDAVAAMRARAQALKPYWTALQASLTSGDDRMLFPPFGNFISLPTVVPLWKPEDANPSQEDLQAARGAIMRQTKLFAAQIRSAFVKQLVEAYKDAPTHDAPIDDVDKLVRLVTSAIACPNGGRCTTLATYPAILDHFKVCGSAALTSTSLTTSTERVLVIAHILAAINEVEPGKVDAAKTTTAELYALGDEAFQCEACLPQQAAVGPATWSSAHSTKMDWTGMVRHLLTGHKLAEQVLPTVVYTPRKPPSETGAAPADDETVSGGFIVDAGDS